MAIVERPERDCDQPLCREGLFTILCRATLVSYPGTARAMAPHARHGAAFCCQKTLEFTGAHPDWAEEEITSHDRGEAPGHVDSDEARG